MLNHGGVAQIDVAQQRRMPDPFSGERIGAIERDLTGCACFRDHEDLTAVADQEWVGEMPWLLEHWPDRANRTFCCHFDI